MHRPGRVRDGVAPVPASSFAVASYGSLPSVQSTRRTVEAPAASSASGRSSLGTIIDWVAVDRDHQHGDAFGDRDWRVAPQVDQVWPGGHQQAGEAGLLEARAARLLSRGVIVRGEWSWCGLA